MLVFSLISITPGQALRCTSARLVPCSASDEEQRRAAPTPADRIPLRPAAAEGHWRALGPGRSLSDVPGPHRRALTSPGPASGPRSSHRLRWDQNPPCCSSLPGSLRQLCFVARFETNWPESIHQNRIICSRSSVTSEASWERPQMSLLSACRSTGGH